MTKPVTPQDMFDLWQKMVNPGAYPLQSLMFPVMDAKELEKKVAELQAVEHWLTANLNMLKLSIKSLEYQRAMLKGGEKFQQSLREAQEPGAAGNQKTEAEQPPNPAMWAWDMMARAGQEAMDRAQPAAPKPKRKRAKPRD
jgi:hypothetical protein